MGLGLGQVRLKRREFILGSMAAAGKLLPTPRAGKHTTEELETWQIRNDAGKVATMPLALAVTLLPTPTTRDYKDSPGMTQLTADGRDRTDQLPRRIYALASSPVAGGMKLTPEFLSWLMGFPPDWLSPLRGAPATPSSRKSSKSSPKP